MQNFVDFWTGIWEDKTSTPYKECMEKVGIEISEKVTNAEELEINISKAKDTIRNWTTPGVDGIPNLWWKKLRGSLEPLANAFNT